MTIRLPPGFATEMTDVNISELNAGSIISLPPLPQALDRLLALFVNVYFKNV